MSSLATPSSPFKFRNKRGAWLSWLGAQSIAIVTNRGNRRMLNVRPQRWISLPQGSYQSPDLVGDKLFLVWDMDSLQLYLRTRWVNSGQILTYILMMPIAKTAIYAGRGACYQFPSNRWVSLVNGKWESQRLKTRRESHFSSECRHAMLWNLGDLLKQCSPI
jgi:hypothetical protein